MTEVSRQTTAPTARTSRWWRTAPNPPCRPWCTTKHAADEFQGGGSLVCSMVVAQTDWFAVEVSQTTSVDLAETEGVHEVLAPSVWEYNSRELTDCTLEEVEEYASALLEAVKAAREVEAPIGSAR